MYISSFPTYLSVCILTKSEFISSCSLPAVSSNIVQITLATFFVEILTKWPLSAILDVRKSLSIAFLASSYRYEIDTVLFFV